MAVAHIPPRPWIGREDPEDGASAKRLHDLERAGGTNALIGFACEAGVRRNKGRVGARQGPAALRAALAGLAAPKSAVSFTDMGDIGVDGDGLEAGQALLAQHVSQALAQHSRVIVLGGGHETAFGSYCGLASHYPNKKIGIINLDAHLDLRNPGHDGPSSGTPFNQIRNLAPEQFDYLCIGVAEEANTAALFERADAWGVNVIMDKHLLADPMAANAQIAAIVARSDLIYLTIDIDLLPHYQAPGVSAPAARGVPLVTVESLIEKVMDVCKAENCPLPLADIVEVSPPHDKDTMTAKSAALLIRHLLCN